MTHKKAILLDTNFLINLLNEASEFHFNTINYYRYFLENGFELKVSTIAIAEYCIKGKLEELPLNDLQVLPFNINHAIMAGQFASIVFDNKQSLGNIPDRNIIPNDTKLLSQAEADTNIGYFATADKRCIRVFKLLKQYNSLNFEIINTEIPYNENFGVIDFPS